MPYRDTVVDLAYYDLLNEALQTWAYRHGIFSKYDREIHCLNLGLLGVRISFGTRTWYWYESVFKAQYHQWFFGQAAKDMVVQWRTAKHAALDRQTLAQHVKYIGSTIERAIKEVS